MDAIQPNSIKIGYIDRAMAAQGEKPRIETYVRPPPKNPNASQDFTKPQDSAQSKNLFNARLSNDEQSVVDQLKARDREVRDHEQAHARVGGAYAGEPSYSYQTGPDGQRYAVGGEVSIDASPVADDPAATIAKMEIVKAAALAPAEPSSQDRKVAAMADAQRNQAVADLAALRAAVNSPAMSDEPLDMAA